MSKTFRPAVILLLLIIIISLPYQTAGQGMDNQIHLPMLLQDYDPNWTWNDIELIELNPVPFHDPYLITDLTGKIHIFWDTTSSPAYLYHMVKIGTGWSVPQPIDDTLGNSEVLLPPLLSDNGRMHLVWYNRLTSGSYRLLYAYYENNEWSSEEVIVTLTQPFMEARMNFDFQGNPHVTYHVPDIISDRIYHRVRTNSGWSSSENITPQLPPGKWAIFTERPERQGGVRIYGDGVGDEMYLFYWLKGSFVGDMIQFQGNLGSHQTSLDTQNNLHAYWESTVPIPGGSVTGLYHQCLDSTLHWGPTAVLSGYDSVGYGSRAGWDGSQRMVFGWKEYRSMELAFVILTGCRETHRKVADLPILPDIPYWGNLSTVAMSGQPGKVCSLIEVPFSSPKYGLLCADVNW